MTPLQRRFVVVQGKGGVGRTTVTAALGLAAARQGRRTCVVELHGQDALARRLGFSDAAYGPREVSKNLHLMCLTPGECMSDFGARKLKIAAFSKMLFESRPMTGFVEAVPGLQDLVQLGKIEDMLNHPLPGEQVFDLVILDAPATGHGLSLLASARAMRQMTRIGPFHDLAAIIETLLVDKEAVASVLVTLPEALPVNESLELVRSLARDGAPPGAVLFNQWASTELPTDPSFPELLSGLHRTDAPPAVTRTLRKIAIEAMEISSRQQSARVHLEEALPSAAGEAVPVIKLPLLRTPRSGPAGVEPLVASLLAEWGAP